MKNKRGNELNKYNYQTQQAIKPNKNRIQKKKKKKKKKNHTHTHTHTDKKFKVQTCIQTRQR